MANIPTVEIFLPDPDATARVGELLSGHIKRGDCILLAGEIGAGKTSFARALIQAWLRQAGLWEDVPSPTYTLVQTYSNGHDDLWHADLYRVKSARDFEDLGLIEAFDSAIVVIEWPDRLGDFAPMDAVSLTFRTDGDGRRLTALGTSYLLSVLESVA